MNKAKAKQEALSNTRTWGELLDIVKSNRDQGGMSKLNKSLTKAQAVNIFENMIKERDLSEVPSGLKYDCYKDREVMSGDGLGIWNLLRECA